MPNKEATRRVRRELNRLPDYYKVSLILRYYKCMSYSDIARTLNRGLPTIRTMIFQATKRLRRNLANDQKVSNGG